MLVKMMMEWLSSAPASETVDVFVAKRKIKELRQRLGLSRARLGARSGLGAFSVWFAEIGMGWTSLYIRIFSALEATCPMEKPQPRWKSWLVLPTGILALIFPDLFLLGRESLLRVVRPVYVFGYAICLAVFEMWSIDFQKSYDPTVAYHGDTVFLSMQSIAMSLTLMFVSAVVVVMGQRSVLSKWRRIGLFVTGAAVFVASGFPISNVRESVRRDALRMAQADGVWDARFSDFNRQWAQARSQTDRDEALEKVQKFGVAWKSAQHLSVYRWELQDGGVHAYLDLFLACLTGDQTACTEKGKLDKIGFASPKDSVGHLMGVVFGLWSRDS